MSLLYRHDSIRTRAIDEAARTATFVAATEVGVDAWCGKEWLRMTGAKLDRYTKNPVVLDAHNRWTADTVIGRATVAIEGRQLLTTIQFAKSPRAEQIWQLVLGGFLRAVSVGFQPLAFIELKPGATDGEGEAQVTGPGIVITQWELYEISMVPVPADEDALLRRSFFQEDRVKNHGRGKPKGSIFAEGARPSLGAPRAADDSTDDGEECFDLVSALKGHLGLSANASDEEVFEAVKSATADEDDDDEEKNEEGDGEEMAAKKAKEKAAAAASAREKATKLVRARSLKTEILEIAPTNLRELAEGLALEEGMTLPKARKRLLEEHAKASQPVGTPEPAPAGGTPPKPKETRAAEIPDDDFVRALKR